MPNKGPESTDTGVKRIQSQSRTAYIHENTLSKMKAAYVKLSGPERALPVSINDLSSEARISKFLAGIYLGFLVSDRKR